MKNLLLASTALIAFGGAAHAEVAISGSGRMGVVYDAFDQNGNLLVDEFGDAEEGIRFSSRVRVAFTLTQETDNGVTFGGSIRADNASAGNKGEGGSVFMSGAFGKISMGDVDGAAESAVGNLAGVGYTGLGDFNEAVYLQQGNSDLSSNDTLNVFPLPGALYEYSMDGFTGYIGLGNPSGLDVDSAFYEQATNLDIAQFAIEDLRQNNSWGIGAKYATDAWWVGAGYEQVQLEGNVVDTIADSVVGSFDSDLDNWMLGGGGTFDAFTVAAQYGQLGGDNFEGTQYGISGSYTWDAFTVTAFVRQVEVDYDDIDLEDVDRTPYGLGLAYDLGGGATVATGIVDPDIEGQPYRADLGVSFTF